MSREWIDTLVKVLGVAGAVATFLWGVWVWSAEGKRTSETRRVEATRPFLDRQLALYTEAARVAAVLSTSTRPEERDRANHRFWQLYWGELALVESPEVEAAMVKFGKALETGASSAALQPLSLRLAHACRDSLAKSWGVDVWAYPAARGRAAPE